MPTLLALAAVVHRAIIDDAGEHGVGSSTSSKAWGRARRARRGVEHVEHGVGSSTLVGVVCPPSCIALQCACSHAYHSSLIPGPTRPLPSLPALSRPVL